MAARTSSLVLVGPGPLRNAVSPPVTVAVYYGLLQATAKRTPLVFSFSSSQYGRTPLHLAANNGILDVVRYLCLMGANVEALTSVSTRQVRVFGCGEPWKLLMPQGHGEKGIAWQLHSKADRLLLSVNSRLQLHKHLPTQTQFNI